jgi:polysaccharide biosynthesis protein PslG
MSCGAGDKGNSLRNVLKAAGALAAVVLLSLTLTNVLSPASQPREYPVRETAAVGSLGFADSWIWFLSPDDVNRQLDLMVSTGVHNARIMMPWAAIQPAPDAYDWGQADTIINAANARGIAVVGLLNSTPGWATGGGPAISSPPADPATFASFAGTVASHFAGRIAAYEVWNEENAVQFWNAGAAGPQPDRFAEMLKAAYPAIKGGDPGATVVMGGLSPTINFFSITKNPVDYLSNVYAAGGGGSFDAVAFHPYLFTSNAGARFSTGKANSPRSLYDQLRGVMANNGDGGKQIWATEFGEATSKVDEATQAAWIQDFITTWRGLPGAGPAFVYTTRDRNTGNGNAQDNYGVYRTDFSPKPAADVIKSLA